MLPSNKQKSDLSYRVVPWGVCVIVWLLQFFLIPNSANKLELAFYDFLSKNNPHQVENQNVVIVGVDQESVNLIGSWPWPRMTHTFLLDKVKEADAIGMDLLFADIDYSDEHSDSSFAKAVQENGKVTLPYIYNRNSNQPYEEILPLFRYSANSIGYVNFLVDNDNMIRRVYTAKKHPLLSENIISFPEAIITNKGIPIKHKNNYAQDFFLLFGDEEGKMIPYSNDRDTYPIYSYDQVLRGEVDPAYFKNKVVLVGSTAVSLLDRHLTPSSAFEGDFSGVLILANITNAMINDDLIIIPSQIAQLSFCLFLFSILALVSMKYRRSESYIFIYLLYAVFVFFLSAALLYYGKVWLPLMSLLLLVICVGIGRGLMQRSRFRVLAYTDALTGLANRHSFELRFEDILNNASKKKTPTTFALMDVDFFKKYNDTYGHDAGDVVLRKIGEVFTSNEKRGEIAARLGGEEFVLVIPNCNEEQAYERVELVRNMIMDLNVEHMGSDIKQVTGSFGVSVNLIVDGGGACDKSRKYYQEADIALYEVKNEGRNSLKIRAFSV